MTVVVPRPVCSDRNVQGFAPVWVGMDVGIATVGNELLSGDIENTNATWLCRNLTDRGATPTRLVVVPDDVDAIAAEIQRLVDATDAVIVTGGIGPTHDDVTMAGIAAGLDRPLEEHDRALEWLETDGSYSAAHLTREAATLPAGATAIRNEVGVAPGARVDRVYVFPGVPREMKAMFEQVAEAFSGTGRHRRVLHVDEPESHLVDRFAEVRDRFDVTVGSYPGGHVEVAITGRHPAEVESATEWLRERVDHVSPEDTTDPTDREQNAED